MPTRTHRLLQFAVPAALLLCLPADVPAQTIISARAGLLSYTDGCVLLDGKHIECRLSRVKHLAPEHLLRTEDGHAEIMLGPEIFLRLGFESEAEIVSTDLAAPQVRLRAGSALIDANGLTDQNPVAVLIGNLEVHLVKKGLYRVDMPSEGPPIFTVRNGQAIVVAADRKKAIPEKHQIELTENAKDLAARRVEDSQKDALDDWNRGRASAIADLNGELLRKLLEQDRQDKDFRLSKWGVFGP
jgi:hypothetical protein